MKRGIRELDRMQPDHDIGYINHYKPKYGCKRELDSAKELHTYLCEYTYHLIGLGNAFRDIARLYGKFHGSNWRNYRGVVGADLKALAEQLNSMDPYDVDAVLNIERAIEALALKLAKDVMNETA